MYVLGRPYVEPWSNNFNAYMNIVYALSALQNSWHTPAFFLSLESVVHLNQNILNWLTRFTFWIGLEENTQFF